MIYGNNILSNTTILNETTILKDKDENISIYVHADGLSFRGFIYDPYFKICKGLSLEKSKQIARIGIKGCPHYIIHNNQKWDLNSYYRRLLNIYMDKIIIDKNGNSITVWNYIVESIIELSKSKITDKVLLNDIILELRSLSKPDFSVILQPEK